jgi:hypothetical protein
MPQHFKDIGLGLFVAISYFAGAYFFTATIVPTLALQVAYPISIGALIIYALLALMGRESKGKPAIVLYALPVVLFLCGVISWITRWLWL